MIKVIKPPHNTGRDVTNDSWSIFLAGSIEMGKAEDWQTRITDALSQIIPNELETVIFNPRRDDWDSSWEQKISNPQFYEQVTWELSALDKSDVIIMYFAPGTKSPISLLELGLHANDKKMLVCCPDGFWRKGNVDIVCERYDIPLFETLDDLILELAADIK